MVLLSQLAAHKERAGDVQGAALLAHVSPVAWQHINFHIPPNYVVEWSSLIENLLR
jgi:hypothetical protein